MTYSEKLARLAYVALWMVLVIGGAWAMARVLTPSHVDPGTGTAGLTVEIDAGTGCQYVVTPWGGIFARLDSEGKPMCHGMGR